jgi:cold shock CspA family protein
MSLDAQTIVDTVASADEATALSIIHAILSNRPELAPLLVNFAVPDLTYPPSKAMTGGREKGVIKSLSREKGFGFIDCAELREVFQSDVFLHIKQAQEYAVGQAVTFAVMLNKDNRPQAYDLIADHDSMMGKGKGETWNTSAVASSGGDAWNACSGGDAWNACSKGKGNYGCGVGDAWSGEAWAGDSWSGEGAKGKMMNMASAVGDNYGDCWKGKGKCKGKGKDFGGCGEFGGFDAGKDCGKGKKGKAEKELGQFNGWIKSFDAQSGYGYIECQDLKDVGCPDDVFLPQVQKGDFEVGAYVQFTCVMRGGKPLAKDLVAVPPEKIPRTQPGHLL